MIDEDLATITEKVMSPQLQCKFNCNKFKVMDWVFFWKDILKFPNDWSVFGSHKRRSVSCIQGVNLCFDILIKMSMVAYSLTRRMQ